MSDFKIVSKEAKVDRCYGLYTFYITKEEIAALLSGKKLYSTVSYDEYAITIEMEGENEVLEQIRTEIEQLPTNLIDVQRPHSVVERDVVELGSVLRILDKSIKAESEPQER